MRNVDHRLVHVVVGYQAVSKYHVHSTICSEAVPASHMGVATNKVMCSFKAPDGGNLTFRTQLLYAHLAAPCCETGRTPRRCVIEVGCRCTGRGGVVSR